MYQKVACECVSVGLKPTLGCEYIRKSELSIKRKRKRGRGRERVNKLVNAGESL